jgi:Protein of unknown function (DUF2934)
MAPNERTFAYGDLEENGDTWLLMTRDRMIFLDATLFDLSLEHKTVSVIGKMGVVSGFNKLIVEKIVPHETIAKRAYEIYDSGHGGSADDNWFHAERELLSG